MEGSCDALGLMKHLSGQTASAYATAHKVLGNEKPDSILKKRFGQEAQFLVSSVYMIRTIISFVK